MNVAIIGAGAIGSVVAGYLTKAGVNTALVGRQDQVEVISKNGLKMHGVRGEETVNVKIIPRLDQNYDLVIIAVKTQDMESALVQNHEFLKSSIILSSQNGVQADTYLKRDFPKQAIYSSIVMFGSTYMNPGEVTMNFEGDWIIGKPFETVDAKAKEITELLGKAFPTVISQNIISMKWLKLFINFNNCIPAVIGKSMQETFADMDFCRLSIYLLKEGVDCVKAAGINLVSLPQFPAERILGLVNMSIDQAAGIMNKTLTTLSKEPLYGSILQSIMRKRRSEIDFINGEVLYLAKELKMDVSLNRKIVNMVHDVEKSGKYFDKEKIKQKFELNVEAT